MSLKPSLIRNQNFQSYLETFFIAAISTILLTRFFLTVAGYPQLGGNGLHVAHVLWGGLLLAIANVLLFTYLGNRVQLFASLIGGIGLGLFIDELGKFLTSDNNYLFAPTFSILYLIFVAFYLYIQTLSKRSLNPLEEAINTKINTLLPAAKINYIDDLATRLSNLLIKVSQKRWFARLVIIFFILNALYAGLLTIILGLWFYSFNHVEVTIIIPPDDILQILISAASGVLVIYGVLFVRKSRHKAYIYFKRYIVISILITQVFSFYYNQLWAVVGLGINLIVLAGLNILLADIDEITQK